MSPRDKTRTRDQRFELDIEPESVVAFCPCVLDWEVLSRVVPRVIRSWIDSISD